jgi:hypothetical protein
MLTRRSPRSGRPALLKLVATVRRYFIDLPHIWPLVVRKSMTLSRGPLAGARGFSAFVNSPGLASPLAIASRLALIP